VAPLVADARRPAKVHRSGVLSANVPRFEMLRQRSPFRHALRELGWVEGKNLAFESRFAAGDLDHLPTLAADLVRLKVNLIVTSGAIAIRAAQHATSTVPHMP
jgi:putative ABC transport system substrate-binding protein